MTPKQIELVRSSFKKVVPIREQAAALFYSRLFEIDPSTKPLFKGDMKTQGAKLMGAIALVVTNLSDLTPVVEEIRKLARRHMGYGVAEGHFDSVGAALLWTLEKGLGDSFTSDIGDAWAAAYKALSSTMIEAMRAQPILAKAV